MDSFLVAREISGHLSSCEIAPCVYSDNDFVVMEIDTSHIFKPGPGVWKFNASLLDDQAYCDFIRSVIEQHLSFRRRSKR